MKTALLILLVTSFLGPLRLLAEAGPHNGIGYKLIVKNVPAEARFFMRNREVTTSFRRGIKDGELTLLSPPGIGAPVDAYFYEVIFDIYVPLSNGQFKHGHVNEWILAGKTAEHIVKYEIQSGPLPFSPNTPPVEPAAKTVAHLRLIVPSDTVITINGKKTSQEGEVRDFVSSPIDAGTMFRAFVEFDFPNRIGRRMIKSKEFFIKSGSTFTFDNVEALK